jgi:S-DNA-T family DNA segregation ATPase FtsK/SpoIIIE
MSSSFPLRPVAPVYRVRLPRPPEIPLPHPFPLLATVAPVFGALALWAIIQSPFALLFAFLGPLIAVASVGDSKISARRTRKRESIRFAGDCVRAREAIAQQQAREVEDLTRLAPGARTMLGALEPDPEHWRQTDLDTPIPVRLGVGAVRSALELDGESDPPTDDTTRSALEDLRSTAATIADAVVVIDARLGVGVCGQPTLARAAARSIVVQLAATLSPATIDLSGSATPGWQWIRKLPHALAPLPDSGDVSEGTIVRVSARSSSGQSDSAHSDSGALNSGTSFVVAVADRAADLPRGVRVVVQMNGVDAAITRHPDPTRCGTFRPDFASEAEVTPWAIRQTAYAAAGGLVSTAVGLPDRIELAGLSGSSGPSAVASATTPHGLYAEIGLEDSGALGVDLVRDGPHAVVGGTTGSGKSELLVSWVLAMAAHRPPDVVSFLFVDFKGGASFDPLRALPHCVGVITDLDEREALRALTSLRAEVHRRERVLAARGLRSIDEQPQGEGLARLVLVVDEYAAMVEDHPDLTSLFTDLAARGRSLGIHLILCTQRPAGTLREGLLANCGLRLSLRVNNAADSTALLGTDSASALPASPVGRVLVSAAGGPVRHGQVATASPPDIVRVAERWKHAVRPARPWCDRLPSVFEARDLATLATVDAPAGLPFALADLPHEQRQTVARFDPRRHGNLLVVGANGSGKSGVLAALAAAPGSNTIAPAPSVAALWDALESALAPDALPGVLLLDDIDMLLGRCPDEWASALGDLLVRVLREGPARGIVCVLSTQRLAGPLHGLAALCGSTILLQLPDRQEHLLAGGDASTWATDRPPGGGVWRSTHIQVVHTPPVAAAGAIASAAETARAVTVRLADPAPLAVVTTRLRDVRDALIHARPDRIVLDVSATADSRELAVAHGGQGPVLIGDPDAWLARWGALGALRGSASVVFDGCSVAEFRSLSGLRELPPPPLGHRALWVLQLDGTVHRATLDTQPL